MKKFIQRVVRKIEMLLGMRDKNAIFFTKDYFRGRKFIIGDYTYGHPKVIFENDDANLFIGKYCSISQEVTIFLGGNHRSDWITTYPFNALPEYFPEGGDIIGHPATKGNVVIGNDVWIGRNVSILSGVTIGNGAIIGTGSVITKPIGAYEIWAGNPARLVKKRFNDVTIKNLEKIQWWNWNDEKVLRNIKRLQSNNLDEFLSDEAI